jgi:hypothetical protein
MDGRNVTAILKRFLSARGVSFLVRVESVAGKATSTVQQERVNASEAVFATRRTEHGAGSRSVAWPINRQ